MLDTEFLPFGTPEEPQTSMLFGPEFAAYKLYQLCRDEDVALAKMLMRPCSLFMEYLSKAKKFSDEGYASRKRVYIVCAEDKAIPEDYQRWQIENAGATEVMEMKDADHMAMISKPQQLCHRLLEIAEKYSNSSFE